MAYPLVFRSDARPFHGSLGGLNYGIGSRSSDPNFDGSPPSRITGLRGDIPLFKNGELGLTFLDFSSAASGNGLVSGSVGSGSLYGARLRLNPAGRFAFSGEASRSVASRALSKADDDGDESSAFTLNLNYNGGAVTGAAGYRYYDPSFTRPGDWDKLGSWYNPTNVQGPYARVGGRFENLHADLGVDYLTGARNRPGYGGFTQGSSVFRGQAGLGYHFSKQFEITANYEGVLYDMSGAISATGLRAKPVEQYLTLGAGLNVSGSTVLRLAYQVINVQDAGNGFGLAPAYGGSYPGGASTSTVFSTQLAIHF